jgi:hypothetical protein
VLRRVEALHIARRNITTQELDASKGGENSQVDNHEFFRLTSCDRSGESRDLRLRVCPNI